MFHSHKPRFISAESYRNLNVQALPQLIPAIMLSLDIVGACRAKLQVVLLMTKHCKNKLCRVEEEDSHMKRFLLCNLHRKIV